MQLIRTHVQPRVINTLDELPPAPSEDVIVYPNWALREWVMIYEQLFGFDDELDPEP